MMLKLNLPAPSDELYSIICNVAKIAPYDWELKGALDRINRYTVNSMTHTFMEDDDITKLTLEEYQKFFPTEKLLPSVGVLRNTEKDKIACFPPHGDRTRIFALNFYVQSGGKDVQTIFYDKHIPFNAGAGTGQQFRYDEVEVETIYKTKINYWYALNVRQIHSVENIEDTRIIYTISFHDMTMADFVNKYSSLIAISHK